MKNLELNRALSHNGSFSTRLSRSPNFLAADPRDLVFGLLGMTKFDNRQYQILPDYTESIRQVFAKATAPALQENVAIIYDRLPLRLPFREECQPLLDLPSWTLDLRISPQRSVQETAHMP